MTYFYGEIYVFIMTKYESGYISSDFVPNSSCHLLPTERRNGLTVYKSEHLFLATTQYWSDFGICNYSASVVVGSLEPKWGK
jgi:hypothetical protein